MLSADCQVCGVPATLVCTRCKVVRYCDSDHQKEHWPQHKKCCKPFKVETDEKLGRYLMATQNIKAKQIIFVEDPIVIGPKWFLSQAEKSSMVFPCVACYTPCQLGRHLCRNCCWPVCGGSCVHDPIECRVLSLGPGPAAKMDNRLLRNYFKEDALLVLKCLLLQRQHPERWTALLEMQSHEEERRGSELYMEADRYIVSYLQQTYLHRVKQAAKQSKEAVITEYDSELLHRICGIIETNYMVIELSSGVELSGLFRIACMMEHNCMPNCYFQFNDADQRIIVRAGCDLKKGDHLKITYSNILWGTHMRQHHLRLTKNFICQCERCLDPTELGSFMSAMLCLGDVNKNCKGIQLPEDPLNEASPWKCNVCPMVTDSTYATELESRMADDIEQLLAGKPQIKSLEQLLARLQHMLHPNHFHMINLKHTLMQLYGHEIGYLLPSMSEEQLNRKQRLCDELYSVCQTLDPHTNKLVIYVTVILNEMANTLEEKARRETDKAKAKALYDEALSKFHEAQEINEKDSNSLASRKLKEKLTNSIYELDKTILLHSHNQLAN